MADAVDYAGLTLAINDLAMSNTTLSNSLNNAFGNGLTKSIESAITQAFSFTNNKILKVQDSFLSTRVFNAEWRQRELDKVNYLKEIRNALSSTKLSTLNNLVQKIESSVNNISSNVGSASPSSGNNTLPNDTVKFYKETLDYLKKISDRQNNPVVNPTIALQGIIGDKIGKMFGGGNTANALGGMIGQAFSRQLQRILTDIFSGRGGISKLLYGLIKGTVGKLFAPIGLAFKGLTSTLGLAAGAVLKLSEVVFGASAKLKDFFEKVTPMKMLLGIIPEAVSALTEFVNMIVMFPLNRIKETEQLAYSTMNSLTGRINDTMAIYGVSQEQAMRMLYQQEVMLEQMPYIYRDSFTIQKDITEQYRSLLKTTGMTVQQAQGLAPVLDKFKNSIIESVDLAGSTLVKLGSKLYGNLDQIVDAYGSTLIKLQNSMNINASAVNQQFQENFAEYFELTTYNSDELIDKSTSMISVLAELNSTVVDSNKLLQSINANRDKLASDFFQSDFGRSVMYTSSAPRLAKMWLDSRDPADLKRFYEDRFEGIRRRFAGFTPETLNTEYAFARAKALGVDLDEVRQVLKQGATATTFQKFSEDKKADRWQEVLKTLAQDYHREWARGHVFIGPDSKKLLQMGNTWGNEQFVDKWKKVIEGNSTIGIHMDKVQQAATMLTVMDKFFGGDFTSTLLGFMGTSIKIANDIFATLVHFSGATIKFIGHFAKSGFDIFNPESSAYQNMVKDVLPSVAMGLTATNRAALHGTEAMGDFGKLMEKTLTKLTSRAQSLSKEYGLDPKNFSPDGRLSKLGKTLIDSATMFSLDSEGNYTGKNRYIEAEYKNRYAQLATASKSGPKAILASISSQLSDIICEAVSKALEGFPGYKTLKTASKIVSKPIEDFNNFVEGWTTSLNSPGKMRSEKINYLIQHDPNFEREYNTRLSQHDPNINNFIEESFTSTLNKEKQATLSQNKKQAIAKGINGVPGRMFTREEVAQMNPFGTPASEQTTGFVAQQPNSVQAVQQAQQAVAKQAVNVQQSQKTLENTFEKRSKEWTHNYDRTIDATHSFRDKVMEGIAEQKVDIDNGFDILEETTISIAKNLIDIKDILAQFANPGIVHFNKFNNNLSTKLNRYLEGMIEFIDAEKKELERQKAEEEKAKKEGKIPTSEDAVGGGEFTGYSGSVFDATITGPYHTPRNGSQGTYYHNGVDFGVSEGTPLPATENAKVTFAQPGWNAGYGKLVILQGSKSGMYIGYAHLSDINVSQGGTVSPGQVIGKSGNTGHSFGPHLHFMVGADDMFDVYNDKTINPLDYLRGKDIKVKGTYTGKQEKSRRGLRRFFNFSLGKKPGLESLASLVALVANSESGGNIAAVRDAVDRGYGKYQFTTLPGSFDNWDRFVRWLGARSEYSILYDRLKNTNGADASSVRPAIQELAKTHHALFEKAQDQHVLEYWYNPIKNLVEGRSMPFKAAALSFSVQRGGLAPEILRKSGALSTVNDREALIKLYNYAYKHLNDPGRYDKETKMLGIYEGMKRPYGGGEGIAYNATEPFTSYDSGLNLASSTISGTAFDGLRPFITGPMQSGSWQVENRYNINNDPNTISQNGLYQSYIGDYASIWGGGRKITSGTNSSSFAGTNSRGRVSIGDDTLYSMGWVPDLEYYGRHKENIVTDPRKFGLTSSAELANTSSLWKGLPSDEDRPNWLRAKQLAPGLSWQKKGNMMVVVKTPAPTPPPPAATQQRDIQQQEMVTAMKKTAEAAIAGAKANQKTAKATEGMQKQMEARSQNIGPTIEDLRRAQLNEDLRNLMATGNIAYGSTAKAINSNNIRQVI